MRKKTLFALLTAALLCLLTGCELLSVVLSSLDASSNGNSSANIAMLGRHAGTAKRLLFADGEGNLCVRTEQGDAVLCPEEAWSINAYGDGAIYANRYGEIVSADGKGGRTVLRASGSPLYLILHGGMLYFWEDGIRRMDTKGEEEVVLVEGASGRHPFYLVGDALYYEGETGVVYRAKTDGSEPERVTEFPVRSFTVDEDFYFTRFDSDNLIWGLNAEGNYYQALELSADFRDARFIAQGGRLYFANEKEGGAVYSALPGGEIARESDQPSPYFAVIEGIVYPANLPSQGGTLD